MILHDTFVALHSQSVPVISDHVMTQADVAFAKRKALSSYRCFADAQMSAAYDQFLIHCEQALDGAAEKPLIDVIFSYLVDVDDLLLNATEVSDKLTHLFQQLLHRQEDVLVIAPLGRAFVDRPHAFSAFLRCLLLRGVTPQQMLSTSLLQDFFRYYLSTLGNPNNPIEQLYSLFQAFPETDALRTLAKTVCCEEGGLASYALDGSKQEAVGSLQVIPKGSLPLCFTRDAHNLNALHALFGVDFLVGALYQCVAPSSHVVWVNALKPLFNQDLIVKTQLPMLFNQLQEYPALQSSLAQILSAQTVTVLVNRHVGGVFHLIPFYPNIVDSIQAQDLATYLQSLRQQASSGFTLISCLMALFDGVKKGTHEPAAMLVFDAILEALLDDPYVLNDAATIQKLAKFSRANDCVVRKARALESTLDRMIRIQTDNSIGAMDYITVEDTWRHAAANIQHLQEIVSFNTTCPVDKYKLYTRLLNAFLEQNTGVDLDGFIAALGIEPRFDATHVTPYERLLFEWLASIDEPTIRIPCIQRLDANVPRPWRTARYGDRCLFQEAVTFGNVGLIQWLQTQQVISPDSSDVMAISAAKANQWAVVGYFYQQHQLTRATLNALLHHAVTHGASKTIQMLCSDVGHSPDLKSIELEFLIAVREQDLECTRCFMQSPIKPCDAVMAKAFKQAMLSGDVGVAYAISEGNDGRCLQQSVDQAMMSAARLNQCDVFTRLAMLTQNRPTQRGVESALLQATRAKQLEAVQSLLHWFPAPRQDAIQRARKAAEKQPNSAIARCLTDFCKPRLRASPSKKRRSEDVPIRQVVLAAPSPHLGMGLLLGRQGFFKPDVTHRPLTPVGLTPPVPG
jgi:hypothetical protein